MPAHDLTADLHARARALTPVPGDDVPAAGSGGIAAAEAPEYPPTARPTFPGCPVPGGRILP